MSTGDAYMNLSAGSEEMSCKGGMHVRGRGVMRDQRDAPCRVLNDACRHKQCDGEGCLVADHH